MNVINKCIFRIYSLLALLQILAAALVSSNFAIGLLSLIQILVFSAYFFLQVKNLLRFDYIFIFFLFILHFPQYMVTGFSMDVQLIPGFNMIDLVPNEVYIQSGKYSLIISQATMLGIAAARFIHLTIKKDWFGSGFLILRQISDETVRKIGATLFFLGILPSLYLDIWRVIRYFQEGYIATYSIAGATSGILNYAASLWKYGVIFLIVSYHSKPHKAELIAATSVVYLMATMLSGHRITALMFIVSIVVVLFISELNRMQKRIKRVNLILLFIIGAYSSLVFINYMNSARSGEEISIVKLAASPISYTIRALSNTISTVCYSIMLFPKSNSIGYGLTYITGWLTVFPNIGGFLSSFVDNNVFTLNIPLPYVMSLGGSYIGELFYNFRYYGVFAAIVLGFLVGIVSRTIESDILKSNYLRGLMLISAIPYIIQWPRAYFAEICRPFVWTSIIVLILAYYYESKLLIQADKLSA